MTKYQNKRLRTWIEIETSILEQNYQFFRGLVKKDCAIMAVVKSNGYGHGLAETAKILSSYTNNEFQVLSLWFGVDNIEEALLLRKNGMRNPILVLGWTFPQDFRKAVLNNISLTVSDFETIEALKKFSDSKTRQKLKIHLKIDTGMRRQGFLMSDMPDLTECLTNFHNPTEQVEVEGIFTHFSSASDINHPEIALKQIEEFKKALAYLENQRIKPKIRHCANTAATLLFPESHFDMVRVGIGLYGLSLSESLCKDGPCTMIVQGPSLQWQAKPALSWKTIISEIKNLPKASKIGYDLTETVKRDSKIAILPIGYWHGLPRLLSRVGYVLINGQKAKILGNISMDMTAVDITGIDAKIGDEAVLIGKSGNLEISADEIASAANTINYEIVTRINPLIQRMYL